MRPRDEEELSLKVERCLIDQASEDTLDWIRSRVKELRVEREVV